MQLRRSGKINSQIWILLLLAAAIALFVSPTVAVAQWPTVTVQICTQGQCSAVDVPDLSGTYTGDDGAMYYVKQSGGTVWWAGMSIDHPSDPDKDWHHGLHFTHIFQGAFVSASTVNGTWADVTRGSNLSFGNLSFSVDTSSGAPQLTRTAYTGNAQTTAWTYQVIPLDDSSWNGSTLDIVNRFNAVYKNDDSSLEDNLKPYRDSTVMYGHVSSFYTDSSGNLGTSLPLINYPDWGVQDRGFDTFVCENPNGDGPKDGDMDITLTIDLTKLEPDFYTAGWGNEDLGPTIFGLKFNSALAHNVLGLDANSAYLHIEAVQYGRAGTCDSPQDPTYGYNALVPGWSESSANSLLVNGRSSDGYLLRADPLNGCDFFQPCPLFANDTGVLFGALGNGKDVYVAPSSYVRVTGALVLDCGHSTTFPPEIHPCYDEVPNIFDPFYQADLDRVTDNQNQEIHPIYSLDIINFPFRPEDALTVNRVNLTGTWAGSDGSTYYVRQIANTIWMFGQTRDKQPMQRGSDFPQIGDLALTPEFQAGDPACDSSPYQCWGFARVFKGTLTEAVQGGGEITGQWVGVPQSSYGGSSGGSMVWTIDYTNKNLVPVASGVFPVLLQKIYEPPDTNPPQTYLSFDGPQYSVNSQMFVNGSTLVRMNGTDLDSGVQNIWYRLFAKGATAPSYTPVLASSAGLYLSGPDGAYELDDYATDNAGNDESAHTNILYLDNTPPQAAIIQPAATTYSHSGLLQLSYSVSDGLGSGVKGFTPTLDGALSLAGHGLASGQTINLLTELTLGPHTFSIASTDNLNNAGTNSVTFSVIVTGDSIKADVTQFLQSGAIDNTGIANSLMSMLNAASAARSAGNCSTAANLYKAFINALQAQSGKHVSVGAASIMIADAQYLIGHCP